MVATLRYEERFSFYRIDESVFLVYPARPKTRPIMFEWFGIADPFKGRSRDLFYQHVYAP
jgi:hypothetical protein